MYGTVMIGTLKGTREDAEKAWASWYDEREGRVAGFVDAGLLFADDGSTVVNWARFESKEAYDKLADDPEQAQWWEERMAPLLEGEPRWVDGHWVPPQP